MLRLPATGVGSATRPPTACPPGTATVTRRWMNIIAELLYRSLGGMQEHLCRHEQILLMRVAYALRNVDQFNGTAYCVECVQHMRGLCLRQTPASHHPRLLECIVGVYPPLAAVRMG